MRVFRHRKFFAFLGFCFLFIPSLGFAQYSLDSHNKAVSASGQNKQKFDQQTFAGFINSANTALIGCQSDPGNGITCPPDLKVGAIPITGNLIAGLYANPPASGLAYLQDTLERFNVVHPAYAQNVGTGFRGLEPLLGLWRAFRNFAYIAFTIVFIAIGLAVMFRMRLDPRTVLTIQSAIPRIVIGLLLVTFSYAIAGFMVDLMYVAISLVILLFVGNDHAAIADLQNQFITGGFGTVWSHLWGIVGGGWNIVALLGSVAAIIGGAFLIPVNPLIGGALIGGGIGVALILLILLFTILFVLFKLFIELIVAYMGIIVAVVLGPLQIALGVIPGMPGFGAWIKGLVANLSIFVAVAFVLMLGGAVARVAGGELWNPPLLAAGGLLTHAVPLLIGIGTLLIVHQIPQAVRNAFGIKGLGFSFGQAVAFGAGVATAPVVIPARLGWRAVQGWFGGYGQGAGRAAGGGGATGGGGAAGPAAGGGPTGATGP